MFLIIDLFSLYINLNHLKELDYKFENCCCHNVIHLILKNLNYHFFLIDVEVLLRNLLVRYFHYNLLNMIEKEMNLTLFYLILHLLIQNQINLLYLYSIFLYELHMYYKINNFIYYRLFF